MRKLVVYDYEGEETGWVIASFDDDAVHYSSWKEALGASADADQALVNGAQGRHPTGFDPLRGAWNPKSGGY